MATPFTAFIVISFTEMGFEPWAPLRRFDGKRFVGLLESYLFYAHVHKQSPPRSSPGNTSTS